MDLSWISAAERKNCSRGRGKNYSTGKFVLNVLYDHFIMISCGKSRKKVPLVLSPVWPCAEITYLRPGRFDSGSCITCGQKNPRDIFGKTWVSGQKKREFWGETWYFEENMQKLTFFSGHRTKKSRVACHARPRIKSSQPYGFGLILFWIWTQKECGHCNLKPSSNPVTVAHWN